MSSKVMKATTSRRHHHRNFRCQQFHQRDSRSSSVVTKTKSFSVVEVLSKLAGPKGHQRFVILKQEEEQNTNSLGPNVRPKIKLELETRFSVPRIGISQVQHHCLLKPLVPTKKRTIVLDLDETLVHSTVDTPPLNYDFMIEPIIKCVAMTFYVLKRPGVDEFLEALSKKYELVVFTAGLEPYASLLLDVLDPKGLISHRLYRDSCTQSTKRRFAKDLSMIGRDLGNVVIVDDNPRSYSLQHANGIPIKKFIDDVEDRELEKLLGFFERDCDDFEDMRDAVKHYVGGGAIIDRSNRTSYKTNHHPRDIRTFDQL